MRYLKLCLLLSMIFLSGIRETPAMQQDSLSRGDKTAQEFLTQMDQKKKEAGVHPFSQGVSSESTLSAEELKGKAQTLVAKDPVGKMVFDSADARPQFKIDSLREDLQKDSLLTDADQIRDKSLEVIGGKGTTIKRVEHKGKDEFIDCEEAGDESLEKCTRELIVKVIRTKVQKDWQGTFFISKCNYSEPRGHYLPCGALRSAFFTARRAVGGWRLFDKGQPSDVNATLNITAPLKASVAELESVKNTKYWRYCVESPYCMADVPSLPCPVGKIHSVTLLKHPNNSQKLHLVEERYGTYNSGRTYYRFVPYIKVGYEEEVVTVLPDEWSSSCARLEERVDQGLCTYDSKTCTQGYNTPGKQTRIINGVPITRDCWEETYTYSCAYPAKNDCGPVRARKECFQTHSQCKQKVGNTCVVYTQTYQCKGPGSSTETITGGQTSTFKVPFCIDGNCRDQGWEFNDEMMSTLAQFSLLKEMQGQIKGDFIFKGDDDRCSKCAVSFKDCCGSGTGWGKSIGLTDCSPEERALKKKRIAGLCHYVGTYCSEKIPVIGTCIKKKSTYCCFGSKLSKAFHEQGRAQIKLGWGEAENPICRGFTIEEIQKIDFSKLDLREVYEELMKNFKPGKTQNLGGQLKERMEVIKKSIDHKKKQQNTQRDGA